MQDVRDNKLFSSLSVIGGGLAVVLALGVIAYLSLDKSGYFLDKQNQDKNKIASVKYFCDNNKILTADFFEKKVAVGSSTDVLDSSISSSPSGSAMLKLDDGRNFVLGQTISADGGRYANKDESFVFWEKGTNIMVLEYDTERYYINCKKYDPIENGYTNLASYTDSGFRFTVKYPRDYSLNKSYRYTALGPDKDITGVKFTVPKIYSNGNNLSNDSYVSVENILNPTSCSASLFLFNLNGLPQDISVNGSVYSSASSSDAGAGNRYDEYVYAFSKGKTCLAVRYFIHYSAIENYPIGVVTEFNQNNLLKAFDAIRDSLNFSN